MDAPQHGELVAARQQQEVALQPGVAAAATVHAQRTATTMVPVLHTEVERMDLVLHTVAPHLASAHAHQPGLPEEVVEHQPHQHMAAAVVEVMPGTPAVEHQHQHRTALGVMLQRQATMVLRHQDQMARQLQVLIALQRQLLVDQRLVLGATMRQRRVLRLVLRLRVLGARRLLRRVLELGVMMDHGTLSKESGGFCMIAGFAFAFAWGALAS